MSIYNNKNAFINIAQNQGKYQGVKILSTAACSIINRDNTVVWRHMEDFSKILKMVHDSVLQFESKD